jgi:hypothetical protein
MARRRRRRRRRRLGATVPAQNQVEDQTEESEASVSTASEESDGGED